MGAVFLIFNLTHKMLVVVHDTGSRNLNPRITKTHQPQALQPPQNKKKKTKLCILNYNLSAARPTHQPRQNLRTKKLCLNLDGVSI